VVYDRYGGVDGCHDFFAKTPVGAVLWRITPEKSD
jgi:hypothetical protein